MYRQLVAERGPRKGVNDAVAVVLFDKQPTLPAGYVALDKQLGGALSEVRKRKELELGRGSMTVVHPRQGAARLYVLGLGERGKLDTGESLRIAAAKLPGPMSRAGITGLRAEIAPGLGDALGDEAAGRAFADGLAIGNFEFKAFKGKATQNSRNGKPSPEASRLSVAIDAPMRKGLGRGLSIAESVNLARHLAATPPNVANPGHLVAFCRTMARQVGLTCKVIDAAQAKRLKMGGLLAVGAAGSTPPAIICLEWKGGARSKGRGPRAGGPVMFVGKAVTFDTGGYSIKPAVGMESMKYDKCGGMAVIGAMHAIARLKLPGHVVGLIPTAENLINDRGYRPSDILTMTNGVTVEVTNTDAEGRLILGDALAYGCKTYKPRAIVDLATLTGGVVTALGSQGAGAFCGDPTLRSHLFDAAEFTGERLWHLPLWEEHKALIKSNHADIVNSGGREAHPIQGAVFLWHFIDPATTPWAHLDIAGVSDTKDSHALYGKGPTGFGVRLLTRAVETWK